MEWLRANWVWVALIGFFFWMHFRMHGHRGAADANDARGGHGGHSGFGGGCCGGHQHAQGAAPSETPEAHEHVNR